jgi:hypothetical protein
VKRIDGALLRGHEHPAGALLSLVEIVKASTGAADVLPHSREAYDGIEGGPTKRRETIEVSRAVVGLQARIERVWPMAPTILDDHHGLLVRLETDGPHVIMYGERKREG